MKIFQHKIPLLFVIFQYLLICEVQSETVAQLKAQIKSMDACEESLTHRDCRLEILDDQVANNLRKIDSFKKLYNKQKKYPKSSTFNNKSKYYIELSDNDELFIINGEKFKAQTYCFNMQEGDGIIFIEGSPFGACATAKLFNVRSKNKCAVWCE